MRVLKHTIYYYLYYESHTKYIYTKQNKQIKHTIFNYYFLYIQTRLLCSPVSLNQSQNILIWHDDSIDHRAPLKPGEAIFRV